MSDPIVSRVDAAGEPLRLLAVHAHPDDESSKGAATMAMYANQGVEVLVAVCTGGERGDILNKNLIGTIAPEDIPAVRVGEMANAARILGVGHVWLGFEDSGLPEGDPLPPLPEGSFAVQDVDEAAGRLVKVIREFRPHVLVTYDENGGYPHPDHIMTHLISMAALDAAADPKAWVEHGEPWTVSKVYYQMTFHRKRFEALNQIMADHGLVPPYTERLASWPAESRAHERVTTSVPCAEYFGAREDALRAHATQVDPDGHWFVVPLALQQQAYPTEDYELVRSTVPTSLPETDLFAGIAISGKVG